jgi:hypothetical protein
MKRLAFILVSSLFIFTNKKRELFDYATTMWDAIGAMYENVYFEFTIKATFLHILLIAE